MPDYNFRMCQYDIIAMGEKGQNLTFDNPSGYSEFAFHRLFGRG